MKNNAIYTFLFPANKTRTQCLTSYDLLKSLALILMVVDHIGYFFFPEETWFRVMGRLSVPIWFFLIGFSDTRQIQPTIWLGAIAVAVSAVLTGEYILPLNILFTLALVRLWIDGLMVGTLRSYEGFAGMFFLLFFLSFPSMLFAEYGTMGMMFAVFGYLRKHKENLSINRFALFGFLGAVSVFYIGVSGALIDDLSYPQMFTLIGGVFVLMTLLFNFKNHVFEGISQKLGVVLLPLKIMGRHTLLIYALHIIVLRFVMLAIGDERFGFLEFKIMPPAFLKILQAFLG